MRQDVLRLLTVVGAVLFLVLAVPGIVALGTGDEEGSQEIAGADRGPTFNTVTSSQFDLFLRDDGTFDWTDPYDLLAPVAPMDVLADPLNPPDFDGDGEPGLTVKKGPDLQNPRRFHEWVSDPQPELCLSGVSKLFVSTALRELSADRAGAVKMYVLDRGADENDAVIGQSSLVLDPWSLAGESSNPGNGGLATADQWEDNVFAFVPTVMEQDVVTGFPFYRLADGHSIVVRIVVGGDLSTKDVWVAYDSVDYPSRLVFASNDCANIQPPVESDGDWTIVGPDMYSALPGNVGIGTEEPEQKLHVVGNILTEGDMSATGMLTSGATIAISGQPQGGSGPDEITASTGLLELWGGSPGAESDDLDVSIADSISLNAQGTYGGGALTLRNAANTDAVTLSADHIGGGGWLGLGNENAVRTVFLDGDQDDAGLLLLNDAAGKFNVSLWGSHFGGGGLITVLNSTSNLPTVVIDGDTNGSGQILLRNSAGDATIHLQADYDGLGSAKVTTSVLEITGGADLSERFAITGNPMPGMAVSVDPDEEGQLLVSSSPYDRKVVGIVSGANGIKSGMLMAQKGSEADGHYPVALTGRVYCFADSSGGEILPGDLLTTSAEPGHCMRVEDYSAAQGAILGKAMGRVKDGMVLVLVTLQ